ncbi:MAG: MFS transporter [Gemmatimonadetes bacterium]|nr:MFS transporter [Gemmatimonadota bacterium]
MHALLRRAVDVRPHEVSALLASAAFFFCALAAWFVLRPMRDAVAAGSTPTQISMLFVGTLSVTLIVNPLFWTTVVKFPPRTFIPIAYHVIVASLLVFYVLLRNYAGHEGSASDLWIGRGFFVWTSVFNLFVTSLFWCFMADVFRSEQAKRLFGFIGVGGTLGSVAGSAATASLAKSLGGVNLLLVSCVLLELAVLAVVRFPATGDAARVDESREARLERLAELNARPVGGNVWAGFTRTMRSPYLLVIAVYLILFTIGSTFLYFEQSAIVGATYADRVSRTVVLARIELAVQVLTVLTQIFLTGRIIKWFGLVTALAFLPVASMLGFGALANLPAFAALAAFVIARRAGNFALTNPGMEVLFTVVPREDKYKAKSFIETFVYRGGDQLGAWTFAGLTAIGLSLAGIAWVAVPISAVWLALGVWLARRQGAMAATS